MWSTCASSKFVSINSATITTTTLTSIARQSTYNRGGSYYEVNQYGADLLRQAVNNGYQEGYNAGQADREDNWRPDFQNSYAYQDALYGYDGYYLTPDDYQYYFRQGFQRGYEDGYNEQYQYGYSSNGSYGVLGNVLSLILNFQSLR
jgi:flagellar biosynthesis/type III secretory pathway protein FliH